MKRVILGTICRRNPELTIEVQQKHKTYLTWGPERSEIFPAPPNGGGHEAA